MGKDKLDKAVKDKLYDLNTPLDTSELWQGIQGKMDEEKKSSTPFFPYKKYIGLGILLFLVMGSSYVIYNEYLSTEEQNNQLSANEKSVSHDASANEYTGNKNLSSTESIVDEKIIDQQRTTSTNINNNLASNTNQSNNTANQKTRTIHESGLGSTRNNSSTSTSTKAKTNQKINNQASVAADNINIQSENIYGSDLIKNNGGSILKASENFINQQTDKLEDQLKNDLINSLNRLERRTTSSVSFARDVVNVCSFGTKIDCYDAWTEDNKFTIVPYIGLDFVTNDRIRTDSFASYLEERQNTMRFLEVIKAGVLMKYNITPNLYVKLGAEYDQIREKFESTTIETTPILVEGIVAYRITMEGDTIAVSGLVPSTQIVTTKWRKYNKYHSFNIPIIFGYQAPIAKRWAYFTEAGVFYNVRFTYQGTLLDQNNQVVSGENYYLNKTGVSLYGGLGISYNFTKDLSAFAVGSYKYNLEPINNADYNPIKQNLGLAGIALGLEIRL